jgi:hypothetical protein
MSSKRQQTMAKMARERTVRERREKKQEKKRLKKLAAAEGVPTDGFEVVDGDVAEDEIAIVTGDLEVGGEVAPPTAPAA